MVRVSGYCKEDSGDEDQNFSDWNAWNRGGDNQEIIPTTEEEERQEGPDDGVEKAECMEHMIYNNNVLRTVSMPSVFQDCDAPRIEVNSMIARAHVQSVEEQLAEIDARIAKFDALNGRDGRLESEISNSSSA
nr:hypothetical protein CFP56_40651 [Quercus suber]